MKYTLPLVIAAALALLAQEPVAQPTPAALTKQARATALQARTGDFSVVPPVVTALEQGTAAQPDSSELWQSLGDLYSIQAAAALAPGSRFDAAAVVTAFQNALRAYDRALKIEPRNPLALSGHGTALSILAQFQQNSEQGRQGFAEVNQAVELNPALLAPRLNRAFGGIALPAAVRNDATIITDLKFLQNSAGSGRAGTMLRLLLGDLYAETSQPALARAEYEAAAKTSPAGRELASARVALLDGGSIPPSEIARLRSGLANCAMCHAK